MHGTPLPLWSCACSIHGSSIGRNQHGSGVTESKSMDAYLVFHSVRVSDSARPIKHEIDTDPKVVFVIDVETSIPLTVARDEPIETSVLDGNSTVKSDIIIAYGLSSAEIFVQNPMREVSDRRFYALMKALSHPSNDRIAGLRAIGIVKAVREAGVTESSVNTDYSMCRLDWNGLRQILETAGDMSCVSTKSYVWGVLLEWKMNTPGRCY